MTCGTCDQPTPANLYQCGKCHQRLQELLERVPGTLSTARETLANMGVQPRVGSPGTSEPAAPINLDMSDRLGKYVRKLVEYAVQVNEAAEPTKPRIFTTPTRAAEYLRAMTNWARQQEAVTEMYTELRDLERAVLSTADRPLAKRPLGECGALDLQEDGTITPCSGTVEGHETATVGRCKTCKREHDLTDRITARLAQAWHVIAPLAHVVKALNAAGYPIKTNTAYVWVHRGKLAPRCDLQTRQEGHTPAEVLRAMQTQSIQIGNKAI